MTHFWACIMLWERVVGNINREVQVSISYTLCIWYTIVHSLFIQCPTSVLALCVVSVGLF